MGRKNQIKSEILEVISSSPNGVSPKEIMKEIGCSESALFYNLKQLKEKGKIVNKDHKYFEKNSKNKINLENPKYVSGYKTYRPFLISKIIKFINNMEGIKFSELKLEDKKKIENKYKKLLRPISSFEKILINSIHISYEGKKPFYLRNSLNDEIIQKIQKLISEFILYPEIFLNLNSLSDLEFTFEVSFGKGLEEELSKYSNFTFSDFKETVINNWGIFLDEMKYLDQYEQITKDQFFKNLFSIMGRQGKLDFIKRNEREIILNKQIKRIERRIYSIFSTDKDEIDISLSIKGLYRAILQQLSYLDLEEIETFQKILTTITKMFLDDLGSKKDDLISKKLQTGELFNDFNTKIEPFINNYNKNHYNKLKDEFGLNISDERILDDNIYKKIFAKIIDDFKNK
ncbi:MAG: hypothetical protein ACFFG0_06195 [Candidatus Thorarchaeota archaeon]